MQRNPVGWFEIPTIDIERAMKFYETVFHTKLTRKPMGPLDMAFFPMEGDFPGAKGALVRHEQWYKPTCDGVLIYFTTPTGSLDKDLEAIEKAGGHIAVPKKLIASDVGSIAVFIDTEGNRIAIHSRMETE